MRGEAIFRWCMLCCLLCGVIRVAGADELVAGFRRDTSGQGLAALALARAALDYASRHHEPLPLPAGLPPLLLRRGAVFVSAMLHGTGVPRCCMGTLTPREPTLAREIIANATAAATCDKRFPPIPPSELRALRVIVSIIDEEQPPADPLALDPLRDGLAVRGATETGVVLPGETDSARTMLTWGRRRAGLTDHAAADYFRLEAIRFMEPPAKQR